MSHSLPPLRFQLLRRRHACALAPRPQAALQSDDAATAEAAAAAAAEAVAGTSAGLVMAEVAGCGEKLEMQVRWRAHISHLPCVRSCALRLLWSHPALSLASHRMSCIFPQSAVLGAMVQKINAMIDMAESSCKYFSVSLRARAPRSLCSARTCACSFRVICTIPHALPHFAGRAPPSGHEHAPARALARQRSAGGCASAGVRREGVPPRFCRAARARPPPAAGVVCWNPPPAV